MSATRDILTILFSYSAGYKRLRQLAYGGERPPSRNTSKFQSSKIQEMSDETLRATLSRMRRNGLVKRRGNEWVITPEGRGAHKKLQGLRKRKEIQKINRKKKKELIIAFDVPEHERYKRDWLREELLVLGFEPIQKSVWFGPGPLPQKFIKELNNQRTLPYLKFFKAREEEIA